MNIETIIGNFIRQIKKYNQIRLILGILMIIFAFPVGKFLAGNKKCGV